MKKKTVYYSTSAILFLIAILYFSYILESEKKYTMIVLWTGAGEHEWAKRLEIVCNNLNMKCKTACCPQELSELENSLLEKHKSFSSADHIVEEFKPDLVISLSKRCQKVYSNVKKYLAISGDSKKIFDATYPHMEEFLTFDGILSASPFVGSIKGHVESSGKPFRGIDWYPSCPATKYEATIPTRLFYCGFQWDWKRDGEEYRKMFSLLDKQGYLDVYGPPERWDCAPNSRKGYLPFDGKSLCQAIRKAGITLILHAQSHLELEAPTSRIFEAASSCSVIISDKHPFIIREFGDNVLYIDGDMSGEELFRQIDEHIKWISSHPKEAQQMAQKAHAIFLKKFTLERQIENLIQFHQKTS